MANRKGLGQSKKFADGSIHENGTGRFMMLERFEGEDGLPWLKYQWLNGEKEGEVEENKEININSSIHKFQIIRKAAGVEIDVEPKYDGLPFLEKIDHVVEVCERMGTFLDNRESEISDLHKLIVDQQTLIQHLADQVKRSIDHSTLLTKQQESLNKLIEKL